MCFPVICLYSHPCPPTPHPNWSPLRPPRQGKLVLPVSHVSLFLVLRCGVRAHFCGCVPCLALSGRLLWCSCSLLCLCPMSRSVWSFAAVPVLVLTFASVSHVSLFLVLCCCARAHFCVCVPCLALSGPLLWYPCSLPFSPTLLFYRNHFDDFILFYFISLSCFLFFSSHVT